MSTNIYNSAAIFDGIGEKERESLMTCLNARRREYPDGGFVLLSGDAVRDVGLVLTGGVHVLQEDFSGNRNLLGRFGPGELFGEVLACLGERQSPVTVEADPGTAVLLLDFDRIVGRCSRACAFHSRLVGNLLGILAGKNRRLQQKVRCVGHRTIREKVTAYLNQQRERAGSDAFTVPLNRAQMADYLCVDRSALSAVLSKMREEGVIRYHRDRFEVFS